MKRRFQLKRLCAYLLIAPLLCLSGPVHAQGKPSRIASLSLASDEILLDVLSECGGTSRLTAVSVFADDPQSSNVVEKAKAIGHRVHSEPESLFRLKPDLVIAASFNRPELLAAVKSKKIPLLLLDKFETADDISQNIIRISAAAGCPDEGRKLNIQFQKKLADASAVKTPRKSALSYSSDLTVMGSHTLFDDLLTRAGMTNAAALKGLKYWPKIDTETLLSLKPDLIVAIGRNEEKTRIEISNHPAWGRLPAMKSKQLICLNPATALSTSHYFADAVIELSGKSRKIP